MDLNQVTIPSTDLRKSVPFYRTLGLRLIVDSQPRYVRFECPSGDSTFSIHRVIERPVGDGVTLYFELEKLDETVRELIDNGIEFELLPVDQRWLWREAHLRDPDGNHLILYHAGNNRKNPPWRVEP